MIIKRLYTKIIKQKEKSGLTMQLKGEKMAKTIINFTDLNVNGCNSSANVLIEVSGNYPVSSDVINTINTEIVNYQTNNHEWDADDIINRGCEILERLGFNYNVIYPDYNIEF